MTNLHTINIGELLEGIKSENTVATYALHWERYLAFAGEHKRTLDDAETLAAWRSHLIKNTQESPNTINLRIASVKSIFKELASRRMVSKEIHWAMRDVEGLKSNALNKRKRKNSRVRIEPEQMRGLISTPKIRLGDPVGARNRALLLLLATSGVRISEAVAVKVQDLQTLKGKYMIANILGKGQSSARIAPLSEEAYLAIKDWLFVRPVKGEYVFTSFNYTVDGTLLYSDKAISAKAAYSIVKRIGIEYGMPEIKPHDFRRFVGTQLAKVNIRLAQKALGHKKITTTADHYVLDDEPIGVTEGMF